MSADQPINSRRKRTVSTRLLRDGGAVLFDPDRNIELFLNPTGSLIWQSLDGRHSKSSIIEHLQTDFSGTENPDQDFDNYLILLQQNNLLENISSDLECTRNEFPWHDESPLSFDLSITGNCNLKCPFCFYADAISNRPDLPFNEWQAFFNELQQLAVREVTLSGGEIFCRSDLFALIDSAIAANLRFSLLSNGTLGNERIISKLQSTDRRRRLNSIQISVDGSCPEIHDRQRGSGSFKATDSFLRQLKQAEFPVTVRVTINRINLNDLENIFAYLLGEIGLPSVSTNAACQMGSAVENARQLELDPHERQQAMQIMRHLADQVWPGRINAQAGPLYESRQFASMELHRRHNHAYNGHLSACGCFKTKLAVHHDGVLVPCNMLGSIELGRINRDSIKTIWTGHPILKKLASRSQIKLSSLESCKNCEYVDICNGGCPATVINQTGDFFKPALSNCYRAFKKVINEKN